jgi:hypothetical protein
LIVYLNTNGLCIESHHGAKSTLGKLENWTTIVVSDANFWDRVAIPSEGLGDNLVQLRREKKRILVTREKLSMAKGKPQQIGMTAEINSIPKYAI